MENFSDILTRTWPASKRRRSSNSQRRKTMKIIVLVKQVPNTTKSSWT